MTSAEATSREVDRLAELASIGAGHAAGALAALVGRTIRMEVPRVRDGREAGALAAPEEAAVVFFHVLGGPGGVLAVFFPADAHPALLERLLGVPASATPAEQAESALGEAGNILASHALSAVADLVETAVVPSPPELDSDAAGRLPAAPAGRLRIETPLVDRDGRLQSLLVWFPEPPAAASDPDGAV